MARTGGQIAVVDVDPRNGSDIEKTRQLLSGLGVRVFAEMAPRAAADTSTLLRIPNCLASPTSTAGPASMFCRSEDSCFSSAPNAPNTRVLDIESSSTTSWPQPMAATPTAPKHSPIGSLNTGPVNVNNSKNPHLGQVANQTPDKPHTYKNARRHAPRPVGNGQSLGSQHCRLQRRTEMRQLYCRCWTRRKKASDTLLDASERDGLVRDDGEKSVSASIKSGIENGQGTAAGSPAT
jgi:hypothetical protein